MRRVLLIAPLLLVACLEDYDVDGMTYPCRTPEDCVDGYECDSSRWVCVEAGTSSAALSLSFDAGIED